jgi:hypothetical protein
VGVVTQTGTVNYSGAYVSSGLDNSLDLAQLKDSYRTEVQSLSDEVLEMDLVGIDPAIANAYRRILIAEVPTMAIDKVFMANNTSIMQVCLPPADPHTHSRALSCCWPVLTCWKEANPNDSCRAHRRTRYSRTAWG